MLNQNKTYFKRQEFSIEIIINVEKVTGEIQLKYSNNQFELHKNIRIYKRFALNRLDKVFCSFVSSSF